MPESPRSRRILVTGGTGTLGYNILTQLAGVAHYTVIAPVRNMHRVGNELRGKVQFIEHELGDAIHTAQIFERVNPDVIVHCAASGLPPLEPPGLTSCSSMSSRRCGSSR